MYLYFAPWVETERYDCCKIKSCGLLWARNPKPTDRIWPLVVWRRWMYGPNPRWRRASGQPWGTSGWRCSCVSPGPSAPAGDEQWSYSAAVAHLDHSAGAPSLGEVSWDFVERNYLSLRWLLQQAPVDLHSCWCALTWWSSLRRYTGTGWRAVMEAGSWDNHSLP